MSNPRDDLRATEQAIHQDALTVAKLEAEKAAIDPSDPAVEQISDKVQEVAASLGVKAAAEGDLVDEIQAPQKRRRRN